MIKKVKEYKGFKVGQIIYCTAIIGGTMPHGISKIKEFDLLYGEDVILEKPSYNEDGSNKGYCVCTDIRNIRLLTPQEEQIKDLYI